MLAVAEELSVDGLVLRYRTDQTDDGLTGAEGTFTTCSTGGLVPAAGGGRRGRQLVISRACFERQP